MENGIVMTDDLGQEQEPLGHKIDDTCPDTAKKNIRKATVGYLREFES